MKLKKGSLEAKRFMAKIRAMKSGTKKKATKKIGATKFVEKKETKTNSHKNTTFIKIGEGGGSYLRGGVGIISRWARTKMKVYFF